MKTLFKKFMGEKGSGLTWLYMMFGVALITANCIASKIMILPFNLFGQPVTLTVGAICYPLTFLITDIIGERYGKKAAQTAVKGGFLCQIVSMIIIIIARYVPAVDPAMQESYVAMFGQTFMFVLASLVAFVISQSWDVWVFHKIRDKYIAKHGSTKGGKWIWNNVGTITSQLIDSILYASIAFGIGFNWFGSSETLASLGGMIFAQFVVKTLLALLDTPFFYLFTRNRKELAVEQ